MEAMRQSWTDDRLDDFRGETQRRFDEVDRRFDKVDERFDKVDERFDKVEGEIKDLGTEMNARFDAVHARFDSLQRTMLWFSGALIVALIGCLVSQAWFVVTQV